MLYVRTCVIIVDDIHVVNPEPVGVFRPRQNGGVVTTQFGSVVKVLLQYKCVTKHNHYEITIKK